MSSEVSGVLDGGGFGTAIMSIVLFVADQLSVLDVNQYLITITSACGIVWIILKIRGSYLDNKLKKLDIKKESKNERSKRKII